MKRQILVWLALLLAMSGCSALDGLLDGSRGSGSNGGEAVAPDASPTPDLNAPEGVAQSFLSAWEQGDYQTMYGHLNANSQASYSLDQFTTWYTTNTAIPMTLSSLTTDITDVMTQGQSAQVKFSVNYVTRALGGIDVDLTMLLTQEGGRWGVIWSPRMILDGLCDSCLVQLDAQTLTRGSIYDRDGQWLVQEDAPAVTVAVLPEEIPENFEDEMLEQLSLILRIPVSTIRQQYEGGQPTLEYALGDTDLETYDQNRGFFSSYPALRVYEKSGRRTLNALAPHVLGYTSYVPQEQCPDWEARGYSCDAIVGLTGLENWGQEFLGGRPGGTLSITSATGDLITEAVNVQPTPTQDITTTLDRRLQTIAQNALMEAFYAGGDTWAGGPFASPGASVVAIDVTNGDILALANYPDYDPNVFNPVNQVPETETRIQNYFEDARKPLLNRATQGEYPPGSVFKVVSMAAALGDGGYDVGTEYTCLGYWEGLGPDDRRDDWLPEGHGTITLGQALTFSCDSYFYEVGLQTGNQDFDMIPDYARAFGFGSPTGLTQLRESPGLIPDSSWMAQTRGRDWSIGDSVNIAIGQGDVLGTPLQIANMMAAIANGGTLYKPQLVRQIAPPDGDPSWTSTPEAIGTLPVSPENLTAMQNSLWAVTVDPGGTGYWAFGGSRLPIAGKTGTAQTSGDVTLPHAWFAGYAPADNPQVALAVVVENAGEGADFAAPIFRRIMEEYFLGSYAGYPDWWYDPEAYEEVIAQLPGGGQ